MPLRYTGRYVPSEKLLCQLRRVYKEKTGRDLESTSFRPVLPGIYEREEDKTLWGPDPPDSKTAMRMIKRHRALLQRPPFGSYVDQSSSRLCNVHIECLSLLRMLCRKGPDVPSNSAISLFPSRVPSLLRIAEQHLVYWMSVTGEHDDGVVDSEVAVGVASQLISALEDRPALSPPILELSRVIVRMVASDACANEPAV